MPNHYCDKHIRYEQEYLEQREKYKRNPHSTWKYNHITRNRNEVKTKQNKFYHTREWTDLRKVVFNRDYSLCQYCKTNSGNIADHVVPIEVDMSKMKDIDNLVTCCRDCHAKKTRWEQEYYGTGLNGKLTHNKEIEDVSLICKLIK